MFHVLQKDTVCKFLLNNGPVSNKCQHRLKKIGSESLRGDGGITSLSLYIFRQCLLKDIHSVVYKKNNIVA